MFRIKRFFFVFLGLFFLFGITAQADVISNYDDVVAEIRKFDSSYHSDPSYHLAQYNASEDIYYFYFSDGQYKIDDNIDDFATVGRMNIHCYSVEATDGAYTIKFCYDSTHFPCYEFVYSNIDVLENNEQEIYFPATSTGGIGSPSEAPDDSLNINDEYSEGSIKSEKGALIKIIIDFFVSVGKWLMDLLPDFSVSIDAEWTNDLVRLLGCAKWFFPVDVLIASFGVIGTWMVLSLTVGIIQFVMRLFTLRL